MIPYKERWDTFMLETNPRRVCQIRHDNEAQVYVTYCPALDIYSQGVNEEQAVKALESAIELAYKVFTKKLDKDGKKN